MTMEYKSNYEKVTEDWKKRFLDMDQERLIERFQLTMTDSGCTFAIWGSS